MSKDLAIGLVGCGVITQRTLKGILAICGARGARIAAVCDPSEANRNAVGRSCPGSASFPDLDAMLAGAQLDAVLIATPIGLHYQQVRTALEAGLHAYTHKTLAGTAEQCRELAGLANERGLRLAASPGQILLPAYREAAEMVAAGRLGDLVTIDASAEAAPHRYEAERSDEDPGPGERFSWEWYHSSAKGGGPLHDMFVYPLAFLTSLLGNVTAAAVASQLHSPTISWRGRTVAADAPDAYAGLLQFGEIPVTMRSSFSSNTGYVPWGTVILRGNKACLELVKLDDLHYRMHFTPNEGDALVREADVYDAAAREQRGDRECHVLVDIDEFIAAVLASRPVAGADAENAARVADGLALISRSANSGGQLVHARAESDDKGR